MRQQRSLRTYEATRTEALGLSADAIRADRLTVEAPFRREIVSAKAVAKMTERFTANEIGDLDVRKVSVYHVRFRIVDLAQLGLSPCRVRIGSSNSEKRNTC
jgi:hypothetical protein